MSSTEPVTDPATRVAGSPGPGRAPRRGRRPKQTTAVSVAYVAGMFMSTMDMHIVNVALPTLGRDFHAPVSSVQWTVLAYLLTLAVVIPASGWIGDRIGNKRTFLIALATFTAASALCGLAQNLPELIAFRALQGIGGGAMTPMGTAMLYRAFPPERRAAVARTLTIPVLVGPGLAPVVGGVFTTYLSWRWVFLVNVPVGVITLAYARAYLDEDRPSPEGRLDLVGLVLSGAGLSLTLYAISEGSDQGWASPQILATLIVGILALVLFVRRSLHRPDPLLRLHLLSDRLFTATLATYGLGVTAFLGSLYLIPIFLQEALHQTPISSGLTTFVEAIGVVLASQTIGRFYARVGPRLLAGVSGLVQTALLGSFVFVGAGTSLWWIRVVMFLAGMCNSGLIISIQAAMFTNISRADTAHASAIYNTERQVAIALGVAMLTTIVAGVGTPVLTAYHAAFGADAALALLGAIAALTLVRTSDARATMVARRG
jgi:EmrB/QacA subfamily drug resistance transporter